MARRAWASFCEEFPRRRDEPVGGRDVPVGAARLHDNSTRQPFSGATGFAPRVAAPVLKGSIAFLAPSKGFLLKKISRYSISYFEKLEKSGLKPVDLGVKIYIVKGAKFVDKKLEAGLLVSRHGC